MIPKQGGNWFTGDENTSEVINLPFWVIVTVVTSTLYTFAEVYPSSTQGFTLVPGGRTGQFYSANGDVFSVNDYAQVRLAYIDVASGQWLYVSDSISRGTSTPCIEYRTRCVEGFLVSEVSSDCGTTWQSETNYRIACTNSNFSGSGSGGPGSGSGGGPALCQGSIGVLPIQVGMVCVGGILYAQYQYITLVYDSRGCLSFAYGPVKSTAIACCDTSCVPVTSGSGTGTGSGSACVSLPCKFCLGNTPFGYTFTIPAALAGNTCVDWPAGVWNVTQTLYPGRCLWTQQKGNQYAAMELYYSSVVGRYLFDLVIYDAVNNWYLEWIFFFPKGATPVECNASRVLSFVSATCQPGTGDGPYNNPTTITPYQETCNSGSGSGGGGGGVIVVCCGVNPVAATLYARFTGALVAFGCVPLINTGGLGWSSTGSYTACGLGSIITLTCNLDGTFSLFSAGGHFAGTAFATNCVGTFRWYYAGTAGGTCGTAATVDITDIPC